jgi:hypothetical protein
VYSRGLTYCERSSNDALTADSMVAKEMIVEMRIVASRCVARSSRSDGGGRLDC